MEVGENIFVYGTLKKDCGANGFLKGKSEYVGDTRISGSMYHLGGFPGVKTLAPPHDGNGTHPFISEGPTVQGELYRITDESLPETLDRYEGYPRLYSRAVVECEDGNRAWVYTYNGDPGEEALVPSGIWE